MQSAAFRVFVPKSKSPVTELWVKDRKELTKLANEILSVFLSFGTVAKSTARLSCFNN